MAGCTFGYPLRTADYKENFHLKSCSQEFSQLKRCGFFFFPFLFAKVSDEIWSPFFLFISYYFNEFKYNSRDILYFRFRLYSKAKTL